MVGNPRVWRTLLEKAPPSLPTISRSSLTVSCASPGYVDSACLECPPPHLSVESKEPEAGVSGKSIIFIQQQMLKLVANCDLATPLAKEVSSTSWEQCGECHTEVPLCGELVDWSSTNSGPHEGVG